MKKHRPPTKSTRKSQTPKPADSPSAGDPPAGSASTAGLAARRVIPREQTRAAQIEAGCKCPEWAWDHGRDCPLYDLAAIVRPAGDVESGPGGPGELPESSRGAGSGAEPRFVLPNEGGRVEISNCELVRKEGSEMEVMLRIRRHDGRVALVLTFELEEAANLIQRLIECAGEAHLARDRREKD